MKIHECFYRCEDSDSLINLKHSHEDAIEFIQPVTVIGDLLVGDILYSMIPGTVYCIDSEKNHCTLLKKNENYCRNKISVKKSELAKLLSLLSGEELLERMIEQCEFPLSQENQSVTDDIFREIDERFHSGENFEASFLITKLCMDLNLQRDDTARVKNGYVENVMKYIDENIETDIRIKDFCEKFYISPSYLCHLFKSEVGISIGKYIKKRQIEKALSYLVYSNLPVGDIASKSGFSSVENFSKYFKKQMSISPNQYRKMIRSNTSSHAEMQDADEVTT